MLASGEQGRGHAPLHLGVAVIVIGRQVLLQPLHTPWNLTVDLQYQIITPTAASRSICKIMWTVEHNAAAIHSLCCVARPAYPTGELNGVGNSQGHVAVDHQGEVDADGFSRLTNSTNNGDLYCEANP